MVTVSRVVSVTSVVYLIFMLSYASGLIHALIEAETAPTQVLLVPLRQVQTISETVITTLVFFLGLLGVYFVHRSTKVPVVRQQKMYFVAGFSVIAISMLSMYLLLDFKL
jgi:hypothetical protein